MVFDAKGKNFRHDIYDEYKANRNSMPAELSEQTGAIINLVEARCNGYTAKRCRGG